MPRKLAIALAALLALGIAAQLALPRLAADRVTDRLTAGGGQADASISAFPAPRLLFGDGDRIQVSGSRLQLDLAASDASAFQRLDGFGDVSVHVTHSSAGPFRIADFELTRAGKSPYHLVARALTTPHDLLAFGADRLGFLGGLALRFGAGEALGPAASTRIPVRLDMQLVSDGGRVIVTGGGGTVAGIPTGPLGELITSAIAVRL